MSTPSWQYDDTTPDNLDDRGRRPVSVAHLVVGLVFLGVAGLWLVGTLTDLEAPDLAVSGPVVLIVAGLIGLAASLRGARDRRRRERALDPDRPYGKEEY